MKNLEDKPLKINIDQLKTLDLKWSSSNSGVTIVNEKTFKDFSNWDIFDVHSSISKDRDLHRLLEKKGLLIKSKRSVSGKPDLQVRLEKTFAKFIGKESCLQFSSRKQAYLSFITSVGQSGDLFLYDYTLDAPISDSAYIIGAHAEAFNPMDIEGLKKIVEKNSFYKRFFIILESVGGEDGKLRPLKDFIAFASLIKAELIIDESYAFGMLGLRGGGVLEHLQILNNKSSVVIDTSYIPNFQSSFICASKITTDFILANSNFLRSDFPPSAFMALALEKILTKLELCYEKKEKILNFTNYVSAELQALGFSLSQDLTLPYIVVKLSNIERMSEVSKIINEKGFLLEQYLAIDKTCFYIRILIGINNGEDQIKELLELFSRIPN